MDDENALLEATETVNSFNKVYSRSNKKASLKDLKDKKKTT